VKRLFLTALLVLTLHGCVYYAAAAEIKIPQATQITMDDGSVNAAHICYAVGNRPMIVVALPGGMARIYYLTNLEPAPTPIPPPDPQPTPQKLSIAIVQEPSEVTPAQARVIQSPIIAAEAAKRGEFIGSITPDTRDSVTKEVPAKLAPFLAAAALRELPAVIILDQAAKVIWAGPVPETEGELLKQFSKCGGQ
jgi:hypothetical protein